MTTNAFPTAVAMMAAARIDWPHPRRARAAGALLAAPLLAAVALAGAPLVAGTPVAAPGRAQVAVASTDPCHAPAATVRPLKLPLCAGD